MQVPTEMQHTDNSEAVWENHYLHWNTIAEEQSQHKKTDIKVLKEMKLMLEMKMALVLDMIVK